MQDDRPTTWVGDAKAEGARAQGRSFLVVGAGVSGLSAAILLARRGHRVDVWEASTKPGGLLAPIEHRGMRCDRGSHRVHAGANPLLFKLTPRTRWATRQRAGRLLLGGRHVSYPLRLASFARGLGGRAALGMAASFLTRPGRWSRFSAWERDRGRALDRYDGGFEEFVDAERAKLVDGAGELLEQGLLSAPAFVVDGEIFHGREHLPLVGWMLHGRSGKPPV